MPVNYTARATTHRVYPFVETIGSILFCLMEATHCPLKVLWVIGSL